MAGARCQRRRRVPEQAGGRVRAEASGGVLKITLDRPTGQRHRRGHQPRAVRRVRPPRGRPGAAGRDRDRRPATGSSAPAGTSRRRRPARRPMPTTGPAGSPGSPSCTTATKPVIAAVNGLAARRRLRAGARRRPDRGRRARRVRPAGDRARDHPGLRRRAPAAAAAAAPARGRAAADRAPDDRRRRRSTSAWSTRSSPPTSCMHRRPRPRGTDRRAPRRSPSAAVLEVLAATEAGSVADGYRDACAPAG